MASDWSIALIIILIAVAVLLLSGQWIALALGTAGVVVLLLLGGESTLNVLGNIAFNQTNSFILTAVPLFIFAGELIFRSGISARFYGGVAYLIRWIPGGLLHSNIMASGIFAAMSGSSVATASAIGSVAIPEQRRLGYNRRMVFGSLAAGGTLGVLIPPSIPLIIYGVLANESIAALFFAALLPGVVLALLFMLFILVSAWRGRGQSVSAKQRWEIGVVARSVRDVLPIVLLAALILGSIYSGVLTPTEAAAMSVLAALVISLLYQAWSWSMFQASILSSVRTTCMVLSIIVGAAVLSYSIVETGISRGLTDWVSAMGLTPLGFIVAVTVIYVLLGMIIEGISMIYLTFPVFFPIVTHLSIDPLWFGVYLMILIEISLITPPIGLNVFIIRGIAGDTTLSEVARGALPYFVITLSFLGVLIAAPDLATWLPSYLDGR